MAVMHKLTVMTVIIEALVAAVVMIKMLRYIYVCIYIYWLVD